MNTAIVWVLLVTFNGQGPSEAKQAYLTYAGCNSAAADLNEYAHRPNVGVFGKLSYKCDKLAVKP